MLKYWNAERQQWIALFAVMGMLAGFIFSMALSSLSMLLFFLNALHPAVLSSTWNQWRKNPFALGCAAFWLVNLLVGFLNNEGLTSSGSIMKLQFVGLPFAFLGGPFHIPRFRKILLYTLFVLLVCGMCYSCYFLFYNWSAYFREEKVLYKLPALPDHIRFCLLLLLSLLIVVYLWMEKRSSLSRNSRIFLVAYTVVAVLFLHVLGAKTGYIGFYILVIGLFISCIWKRNKRYFMAGMLGFIGLMVTVYTFVPRVRYQMSELYFQLRKAENPNPNDWYLNDVERIISMKLGLSLVHQNPLLGTGAGNIRAEMWTAYNHFFPGYRYKNLLVPHNQLLCTLATIGIPLGSILMYLFFIPFLYRGPNKQYLYIVNCILLFDMLIDPLLQIHFGIFVYLFSLWIWLVMDKDAVAFPGRVGVFPAGRPSKGNLY